MPDSPPTSVLLPTVRWTDACGEVADQLRPADELLIICDDESDPVADRVSDAPENVRLVVAGGPRNCSGKANAIAAGMEAAAHERIVWTDDDFHHPPDWLAQLQRDYDENGPVSELPFFEGRDPLAVLLEPIYAVGGTLGVYLGDMAWGGAVIFERSDLDEATFLDDLRRTVSDDGLLSERLDLTAVRRVRRVQVGGTLRQTLERHVRFSMIVATHDPLGSLVATVLALLTAVSLALFPVPAAVLSTVLVGLAYLAVGVRRWTALLAYPSFLLSIPLAVYVAGRRTFVWGGRRYRWPSKFDVEVLE